MLADCDDLCTWMYVRISDLFAPARTPLRAPWASSGVY
jgi:hypothetical protein